MEENPITINASRKKATMCTFFSMKRTPKTYLHPCMDA
jgi:hypothetical protein